MALTRDAALRFALIAGLVGAALIHATQVQEHLEEWWAAGSFFIIVTVIEVAIAGWAIAARDRRVYLAAIWTSALTLAVWAVSRATGVPFGPERWLPERVGRPDIAAGILELLAIVAAVMLLRGWPRRRSFPQSGVATAVFSIGILIGGTVTFGFTTPKECAEHGDWPFGPLVPVEGHAMVYEDTPITRARPGEPVVVAVGYLKNCGARTLRIDDIDLSAFGNAGRVEATKIVPVSTVRDDNSVVMTAFRSGNDAIGATVPPTRQEPVLVLAAEIEPRSSVVEEPRLSITAVYVEYDAGWRNFRAPFGSAAQLVVDSS